MFFNYQIFCPFIPNVVYKFYYWLITNAKILYQFFLNWDILIQNPFFIKSCLFFLLVFPLVCIGMIYFFKFFSLQTKLLNLALYLSTISFIVSLLTIVAFNSSLTFQAIISITLSPLSNIYWLTFALDSISLSLIVLTNLFIYLCILSIRFQEIRGKFELTELLNKLFFIQWGLVCAFSALDLLGFFIFFEATLIPIFTIILQGGSRERKTRASYLIALYTLFGSIFMLFNILYLSNKYGTTNYIILYNSQISPLDQKILWITFFLAFATKIPVFPFHLWLPEAHVEAPTIGSVLLAALLLKLGIYGMIKFGLPLFPFGQEYFKQIIVILTVASFFYTNLTAIRQVDIKKIIAYSSVVHMNLIVLGILCLSVESLDGAIYQMLAHGIVSGALFFCIGIIYERVKSRFLWYYGGLAFLMPLYSIFLFIFILANISFPTTSNFIGEMLLFVGIFKDNFIIGFFAMFSMFWGIIYNVWTYNRICFGNIKFNYNRLAKHSHISYSDHFKRVVESELFKRDVDFVENHVPKEKRDKISPDLFWNKINEYYFGNTKTNSHITYFDIDKKDFYILFLLTFLLFLTGIYSNCILNYISVQNEILITHVEFLLRT